MSSLPANWRLLASIEAVARFPELVDAVMPIGRCYTNSLHWAESHEDSYSENSDADSAMDYSGMTPFYPA
jgi:hypothetical protein